MTDSTQTKHWQLPFFTLWTGQALSLAGSRIAMFALVWWVTETTGSATVLAMATLFAMLPQIVLGPFAGAYVDRWNRRVVMIVADALVALASLGLALVFLTGHIQIWHVYAIMLIRELGGIFHWPAMQASTSLMVPQKHLARVSGVNQAMMGMLTIIGPALGAILLEMTELHNIMFLDVVTATLAIVPLFFIAIPQPVKEAATEAAEQTSIWQDVQVGARYLFGWRGLMILTGVAMVVKIALTPAFSLLPILVTQHFNGAAGDLAGLEMAFGIGLILGGLLLGVWGGFQRKIYTMFLGFSVVGVTTLLLGLLPSGVFGVAVGVLFAMGLAVALTDGPLFAILQSTVAPEMQGRVFMLFGSLITLTSPVGLAIAGPVTDHIGIQVWYIVAGLACIIGSAALLAIRSVRDIELYQWTSAANTEHSSSISAVLADEPA